MSYDDEMVEYLQDLVLEYITLAEDGEVEPSDLTNAIRQLEAYREETDVVEVPQVVELDSEVAA